MPARALAPEALLRAQPFAPRFPLERVEPAAGLSGTARIVCGEDGRRYKLRSCRSRWRAREIERLLAALPGVCPRVVARRGSLLLCEVLEEHRPLLREELLERVDRLGAMVGSVHREAERLGLPGALGLARARVRSRYQLARDLRLLAGADVLERASWDALRSKLRDHRRRFGLPIAVELDDLHKGNLMLRESDGDLRFVDEEGVAVRPLGSGLASLVKTADREEHWRAFRGGYAGVRDPAWITPAYTEYVVLLDTARKVANKLRMGAALDSERAGKLPDEIGDLERVALRSEPGLDWDFHRG